MSIITPINTIPNLQPLPFKTFLGRVDGVFEGGGGLGMSYLGALRFLEDRRVWFRRVAGNSAGAIVAAMIAVGFDAEEIEWLSSAYPNSPKVPDSLKKFDITKPIHFNKFLDPPRLEDLDRASRRKTFLWRWLKGQIIDDFGRKRYPVPTQKQAVDACIASIFDSSIIGKAIGAIPGAKGFVRDALNLTLVLLPDAPMKIKDLAFIDTETARVAFADTVWDALAANSAEMRLLTNLVYEGSIFEGKNALQTFKELFGRKIHGNPKATVLFKELKTIPLAVLAADVRQGRLVVYSTETTPNFEVAEAVRQSMSIPLVFQPRVKGLQGTRRDIVDGGVFSNFPLWLMTTAGDAYWPADAVDPQRLKAGFVLGDKLIPPKEWGVGAAPQSNVARTVDESLQQMKDNLLDALVGDGMARPTADETLKPFMETELLRQSLRRNVLRRA